MRYLESLSLPPIPLVGRRSLFASTIAPPILSVPSRETILPVLGSIALSIPSELTSRLLQTMKIELLPPVTPPRLLERTPELLYRTAPLPQIVSALRLVSLSQLESLGSLRLPVPLSTVEVTGRVEHPLSVVVRVRILLVSHELIAPIPPMSSPLSASAFAPLNMNALVPVRVLTHPLFPTSILILDVVLTFEQQERGTETITVYGYDVIR